MGIPVPVGPDQATEPASTELASTEPPTAEEPPAAAAPTDEPAPDPADGQLEALRQQVDQIQAMLSKLTGAKK